MLGWALGHLCVDDRDLRPVMWGLAVFLGWSFLYIIKSHFIVPLLHGELSHIKIKKELILVTFIV